MTRALLVLSVCLATRAAAVGYCGGTQHQNTCGRSTNIYPCCPNGSNCTWWAWEMVCRNWNVSLVNWGNANTWAGHANVDPNYDLVGPTVGSIATSTLGRYGHVAWVIGVGGGRVTVTEQNCCTGCSANVRTIGYPVSKFNSGFVVRHGSQCECAPGQQQSEPCGDCGRRVRTCNSGCRWDGWSGCAGPDPEGGNRVCASGRQGVCAEARQRCASGTLTCRSLVEPSVERCDGLDNDCNGATDEGHPEDGASQMPFAARRVDSSFPRALAAGAKATLWVEFRNVGRSTWERGAVWLATRPADGGVSAFSSPDWPAFDLAGGLTQPVAPGEVGRFVFEVTAPTTPGAQLHEKFLLEGAGRVPMICPDGEFELSMLVLGADGRPAAADAGSTTSNSSTVELESRGCSAAPGLGGLWLLLALRRRRA